MRAHALVFVLGAGLAALPVRAADIALVIDADPDRGIEAEVTLLGELFAAQGYEVYERADATREDISAAMGEIETRLDEITRLVVVFAGDSIEVRDRLWLLPANEIEGPIAFDAVSLDTLLDIAGERPGRAAVVIAGTGDEAPAAGAANTVPQGVLLVTGEASAAFTALTDHILTPDVTVADALDDAGDVTISGFVSPNAGFATLLDDAAEPMARPAEPEAEAEVEAEPGPEEIEAALELDQAARRGIQEDLTVLGYNTRGIDGIFGPGTRGAISEWQADQDMTATGFIAPRQLPRLRAAAETRGAELAAAADRARQEEEEADAAFWRTTGAGGSAADLRAYLDRYPDGIYAAEARAGLDREEAAVREAAAAEDRAAWESAQAQDDAAAYERYLGNFAEGSFAEQARARIDDLDAAPREAAMRAEAEAREAELGLNRASRALIEGQLGSVGFDPGAVDGEFDQDARRAIREFQTRQGLPVTGYIDQGTVQALIVASLGLR